MKKAIAVAVCLVLGSSLALAQDGVKKGFDFSDFENAIKNDLKKDFAKKQGDDVALYDIKGTPYFAVFNKKGGFILFSAKRKSDTTAEKMNAWNRDAIYSRVYVTDGVATFEGCLSVAGGSSGEIVAGYYRGLDKEFEAFQKYLGGN